MSSAMGFPGLAVALWCLVQLWTGLTGLCRSRRAVNPFLRRINLAGAQSLAGHLNTINIHSHLFNQPVVARCGHLVP